MSCCAHCGTKVEENVKSCPSCGKPPIGDPAVPNKGRMHPLAIVAIAVAVGTSGVVGVGGALAIPNLLNAIHSAKQRVTMADIQTIAMAVEKYAKENNSSPTAADIGALKTVLEPVYIKSLPDIDGWHNAIVYQPGATSDDGYTVRSNGRDGAQESSPAGGQTHDFDCDIILADGQFVQWPEGPQR